MDMAKNGAKILVNKLQDKGCSVSLRTAMTALGMILPLHGKAIDVSSLITSITNASEEAAIAAGSWMSRCTSQSITPSDVFATFGTRDVGRYAQALGVGVRLSIDCLALSLPEMIEAFCEDYDGEPVLDLMSSKP